MAETFGQRVRGYVDQCDMMVGSSMCEEFRGRLLALVTHPLQDAEAQFLAIQEEIDRRCIEARQANQAAVEGFRVDERIQTRLGPATVTGIVHENTGTAYRWLLAIMLDSGQAHRGLISSLQPRKLDQLDEPARGRFDCEVAFGAYVRQYTTEAFAKDMPAYIALVDGVLQSTEFQEQCYTAAEQVRAEFPVADAEAQLTERMRILLYATKKKGGYKLGARAGYFLGELRKELWNLREAVQGEQDYPAIRLRAALIVFAKLLEDQRIDLMSAIRQKTKADEE